MVRKIFNRLNCWPSLWSHLVIKPQRSFLRWTTADSTKSSISINCASNRDYCFLNRSFCRPLSSDSSQRGLGKEIDSNCDARNVNMDLTEGQRKTLEDEVSREKERYLRMDVISKRKFYSCGNKFVDLSSITSWTLYALANHISKPSNDQYKYNENINNRVSLYIGDITTLEIDCIVNAANKKLAGGGGVDGAIHKAAGTESLKRECKLLDGCPTGEAKITGGYKLPAKYVIHTVGPIGEKPDLLRSCYTKSCDIMKAYNLKSIAFPCISTGVYQYPNEKAAGVALGAVRTWLDKEIEFVKSIDRIIFCLFVDKDVAAYKKLMPYYFPTKGAVDRSNVKPEEKASS